MIAPTLKTSGQELSTLVFLDGLMTSGLIRSHSNLLDWWIVGGMDLPHAVFAIIREAGYKMTFDNPLYGKDGKVIIVFECAVAQ